MDKEQQLRFVERREGRIDEALKAFEAKMLGDAREDNTTYSYYFGGKPDYRTDSYRDLYNNAVGRAIGDYAKAKHLSQSDIVTLVSQALQHGDLITTSASVTLTREYRLSRLRCFERNSLPPSGKRAFC